MTFVNTRTVFIFVSRSVIGTFHRSPKELSGMFGAVKSWGRFGEGRRGWGRARGVREKESGRRIGYERSEGKREERERGGGGRWD